MAEAEEYSQLSWHDRLNTQAIGSFVVPRFVLFYSQCMPPRFTAAIAEGSCGRDCG
jgi:hypothetical protein